MNELIERNDVEGVRAAVRKGLRKPYTYEDWPELKLAAKLGYTEVGRALLESGFNVDAVDSNFMTALHMAAKENHVEFLTMLLDAGADINMRTLMGKSPLNLAEISGSIGTLEALMERGCHVEHCRKGYFEKMLGPNRGEGEAAKYIDDWIQAHKK